MSGLVHGCGRAQGLAPRKGPLYAKPILGPAPISMFWPQLLGATCLLAQQPIVWHVGALNSRCSAHI